MTDMRLTGEIWDDTFPNKPWPGMRRALAEMADEIKALRLLTDTIVTTALDAELQMRGREEIQRAHDVVGSYCMLMKDAGTFEHVSALCWVLRHQHNTAFDQILETVQDELKQRGLQIVRLPGMVDPRKEG